MTGTNDGEGRLFMLSRLERKLVGEILHLQLPLGVICPVLSV